MRILHIEDDDKLRGWVKTGLRQAGFAVDGAGNAKEGLQLASENIYDIILMDIGLPKMTEFLHDVRSGYDAIRTLRSMGYLGEIIVISGYDGEEDKQTAYNAGADDYMTKPIWISELVAKVHRRLQRPFLSSEAPSTTLVVGKLKLDLLKNRVSIDGQSLPLTPKEKGVLEYLMRHAGKIVTQTQIYQSVWNLDFETNTNPVEVHINSLRNKIDEKGKSSIIQTIRGAGYLVDPDSEQLQ